LLLAAIWTWACSSAWFWGLAVQQDALLPDVPRLIWVAPGSLWQAAPAVFLAALAATTLFFWFNPGHRVKLARFRFLVVLGLVMTGLAGLVWGRALLTLS
jgi:hypothetical protein